MAPYPKKAKKPGFFLPGKIHITCRWAAPQRAFGVLGAAQGSWGRLLQTGIKLAGGVHRPFALFR